jgi:hypothetical protein
LQPPDYVEASQPWHLQIQKNQLGRERLNGRECPFAILGFSDYRDRVELLQFLAQHPAGDGLIVDNQCPQNHDSV